MDEDDVTVQAPKRMFLGNSSVDIVSNLPGNIIDSILICLPIKDAARTSVLSKKWRFKWHYIPEFVFNHDDFALSQSQNQVWFQIFQVLALHRGPLQKFVLSIELKSYLMNQIILILPGKDIQEFTLSLPSWKKPRYKLVSTLFDCVQLKHLDLSGCVVRPPPEFTGFSRLISVEFHRVRLSGNNFKTFISKCPLLERLTVEDVYGKSPFEIDAPNLKFLYFDCRLRSIRFRNVPFLSTVKLEDCLDMPSTAPDVVHVFYSLPAIEYFYASFTFLCSLGSVIPERLPTMLNYLKTLELRLYLDCLEYVKFPLLLIKSSPNLQKFKIQLTTTSWAVAEEEEKEQENCVVDYIAIKKFLKGESLVEYATNQLQEVTIKSFRCTEVELEFLKLLLVKSLVIKKVIIQLLEGGSNNSRDLKIQEEVTRLQKASQEAEITFL